MSHYHWQCGDCGSYCDTGDREYAIKFGDQHRCAPLPRERQPRLIPRPGSPRLPRRPV
jgi:hypothetical protein